MNLECASGVSVYIVFGRLFLSIIINLNVSLSDGWGGCWQWFVFISHNEFPQGK